MIKIYSALITDFTQADYTNAYRLLENALKEKIDAKKSEKDKMRSLAGIILLYKGAFELYKKTDFKIKFNKNGKPLCDFCFFNISHSQNRVVCVLSDEPVGMDIQKIKPIKRREKYKFFTDKENDYVNSGNEKNSLCERFTEIFTKKESALKMLGLSLADSKNIDTFSNRFKFMQQKDGEFITTVCLQNNTNL